MNRRRRRTVRCVVMERDWSFVEDNKYNCHNRVVTSTTGHFDRVFRTCRGHNRVKWPKNDLEAKRKETRALLQLQCR